MAGTTAVGPELTDDDARPARRVPAEPGLWVLIFGELGMFALLFGAIVVLRGQDRAAFDAAQSALHPVIGAINTVVLLLGSLVVVLAADAAGLRASRASLLYWTAAATGIVFIGLKAVEYTALVRAGHTAGTGDFFMDYFVITGIHLGHVVFGTSALVYMAVRVRRATAAAPLSRAMIDSTACFWHLVDVLWLALFPLLYLVR